MSVSAQDPSYTPFRLFLSYSRQDYPIVREFYERLTSQASPVSQVWLDQVEIKPTSLWQAEIRHGLDTCDAVLLIASQYALASEAVRDEWLYALAKGKPVYVWLIDNVPLDPRLADCPRFDLRADPLDGVLLGQAIGWLRPAARGAALETPPEPMPLNASVLPTYVKAHRRVLVGLQIYATVVQLLVFWLVALDQYRTVTYHVIEGIQFSPLLTAPLAGLAVALDWALFVRQMRRLSRRRMPYEHVILYFAGTGMLKLLIPVLIMPPYTGPLLILTLAQVGVFLVAVTIARRKSPLVIRSRTWRSNAEAPDQQRWFPVFPVRESLRPPTYKSSKLLEAPPQRQEAGTAWPKHVLVLYDPWDACFGEYLAAYYQHRVSDSAEVVARPLSEAADALPAAERLYLILSPHSFEAMKKLVARPDIQDRQFILVLLQDTKRDDSLNRYQWIDARGDYQRAFQQIGRASVALPRRPPPRRHLLSLAQPHPRAVSIAFLAIGFLPLGLSLTPLIILYLYGINLLGAVLPAAGNIHLETAGMNALLIGLVVYILAAGYWRRCYSTRLILAAWVVFFLTSMLDSWTSLPMLILGAPFALALLRMSRLPREVDGVIDGFDFIEMLALGIWQPRKRFEWPLFLVLVLLGGVLVIGKIGAGAG